MSAATPTGDVEAARDETGRLLTVEEAARYYAWALEDRDPERRGYARGLAAAAAALRAAPQPEDAPQPSGGALTDDEREALLVAMCTSTRHEGGDHDTVGACILADDPPYAAVERILIARAAQRDPQPSEAAARAIAALHVPWYEVNGVRHDHTVTAFGDDVPADHVCRIGPEHQTCHIYPESPEDSEHEVLACAECRQVTSDGETGYLFWPCPTARILAAQPSAPVQDREAGK